MGIVQRRDRERMEMRKLIHTTAMQLFIEKGYDNITIRKIAERIEYSPATVYLYFKDKNEIFATLQTEGFQSLGDMLQIVFNVEDAFEQLRKLGRLFLLFALENPEYYDLMFIYKGQQEDESIQITKNWRVEFYEVMKRVIKSNVDAGYLKSGDIDTITYAFWSVLHGMAALVIREKLVMFGGTDMLEKSNISFDFYLESIKK